MALSVRSSEDAEEAYVYVKYKLDDAEDEPETFGPPGILYRTRDQEEQQQLPHVGRSSSFSSARQLSMHRRSPSISSYQSTPITKHYDISKQILSVFDRDYHNRVWVTAYAVGLQFVELALLEIPKHGYFYSTRHERERMQNSLDAVRVANQLKTMDGVEGYDAIRVEKLLSLGLQQVEKASSDQEVQKYQDKREILEEELRTDNEGDWITVKCEPESLLASCSESFASLTGVSCNDEPPAPIQPDRSESSVGEESLGKALYLSGLEIQLTAQARDPSETNLFTEPEPRSSSRLDLSTLSQLYHEDFDALQHGGRVRVSFANTYQGKIPGSTNGCAVIAPLLAQKHLQAAMNDPHGTHWHGDSGLLDSVIEKSIDFDAPIILGDLREKLGLSDSAFLIPSDVHDYFMDSNKLLPNQFLTVNGGNILDDTHLSSFARELDKVKDRRVAATFFFHEHVIAILKLRRVDPVTSHVSFWYDLIDSLPLKETLRRESESPAQLHARLGLISDQTTPEEQVEISETDIVPRTVRIRSLDQEALVAVLRWYACSKFNEENIKYIDQYPWDDVAFDFDPRVFQAFVWGSAEGYHGQLGC